MIAHDRRGGGRSEQPWTGNDMDTYADDLADLLDALDVTGATLVGHSTGGGEVVRVGVHLVAARGLVRAAVAAAVVGDRAVSILRQENHLRCPGVCV